MYLIFVIVAFAVANVLSHAPHQLPKHRFPCGRQIPSIGYSTKGLTNDAKSFNTLVNALEGSYRVIETAHVYNNSVALGVALKQEMVSRVPKRFERKDVFVIGKVWNNAHMRVEVVKQIMRGMLRDLDFEYLDAGLLHWPTSFQVGADLFPKHDNGSFIAMEYEKDRGYLHGYRGLEAAFLLGAIGHIGVSHMNIHQLKQIFDVAFIRPVILEVECHPLFRNEIVTRFAKDNNMTVLCENPLRDNSKELLEEPTLKQIAKKLKKNVQQVALRWSMQMGNVVLPNPKDKRSIRESIEALNFQIAAEDMEKINSIKELPRTIDCGELASHPDYPFGADA